MWLAFIDDSQQQESPRRGLGHLEAIGAVIVREQQIAPYAAARTAIHTEISVPDGEEITRKPPKGSFLATAGDETEFAGCFRRYRRRRQIHRDDHRPLRRLHPVHRAEVGREILKWLFERVSVFLDDRQGIGTVIADKPGGG